MSSSQQAKSGLWDFSEPAWATKGIQEPPGFRLRNATHDFTVSNKAGSGSHQAILEKQSWEIALAPGKSIFMNLFMIWMMGTGSGIFSILMVGYAVMQSFSSFLRVNDAFKTFDGKVNVILQKACYVAINVVVLGYLCNHAANMGLFPINIGDWVGVFESRKVLERSVLRFQ